jgi:Na+-transporting NADH:ubiquinone oxidoreductase subunit A
LAVHEGDCVKAGDALFVNKLCPDVRFASPVSGQVTAIVRGDRRKVLCVKVKADDSQQFVDFGKKDVNSLDAETVKKSLLEAGLFGYINQLPYAVSTTPDTMPKAIFVSALRDKPLAGDFEIELRGNESAFQAGLSALSKIAKVYLGIGTKQSASALVNAKDVEVNVFDGPCPAGNVGVQINHISPVNKGEVVWTVDPSAVIFFGRLFLDGKVDLRKKIAVAGNEVNEPGYTEVLVGTPIKNILDGNLKSQEHIRILNGNPLTGKKASLDGYLGANVSEITVIPEGDDVNELLGWIAPRTNQFSVSRTYFSWLFGKKKEYNLDARIKGGERHMIMSGEYDKVFPMDIFAGYLVKAIIAGDIDRQEALGIYEVSPEDFALAEFVDSSKLPLQQIVRDGLNTLRKENA